MELIEIFKPWNGTWQIQIACLYGATSRLCKSSHIDDFSTAGQKRKHISVTDLIILTVFFLAILNARDSCDDQMYTDQDVANTVQ